MRYGVRLAAAAWVAAGGLLGCGGGIKEGTPPKIDMSKNYSPAAKPLTFAPNVNAKGKAQAGGVTPDAPEAKK
jgi:hypothetical protein